MGIEDVDDSFVGILRVTAGTAELKKLIAERRRFSFDEADEDRLYDTNIEIAELNALMQLSPGHQMEKLISLVIIFCFATPFANRLG